MNIGSKKYRGQTLMIKTVFSDSIYLVIKEIPLSGSGKINPNKISITLLTDIE